MDKLLEKDYVIRILALLIAVLLWFQATSAQNPVVERDLDDVAVRIQNVESGFTVVDSIIPETVDITVSGPQHLVSALTADDVNVYIDLASLEAGTHTRTIRFIEPPGIKITEISPSTAEVTIEPIVKKIFSLSIIQQGLPEPGYSIGTVTFTPEKVEIQGAESVIESIANAALMVNVSGVEESFERNVAVNVFDASGNIVHGVTIVPANVFVQITVVQAQSEKQVTINPSLAGEPAEGYQIAEVILEPARVTITGPQATVQSTDSVLTEIIDISGITEDLTVSVGLQLPSGLAIVQPTSFRVIIRIEPSEPPAEESANG